MRNSKNPRLSPPKGAHNSALVHLHICVNAGLISRFLKLLEHGFRLKIETSLPIRELLCHHFGISEEYVDNRIQTIFLNGRPVDDVDAAWIENGSNLALSAAMPGLVGASFRKGGYYTSLRDTISYTKAKNSIPKSGGEIVLKLFNIVAKELGPEFLEKGIRIEGKVWQNFVQRNQQDLKTACHSIRLNDTEIDIATLIETNWKNEDVFLQVTSQK